MSNRLSRNKKVFRKNFLATEMNKIKILALRPKKYSYSKENVSVDKIVKGA